MLLMTANFSALSSFFKLIGLLILLIVLLFAASFVSKWYAGAMSGKKYAGNIKIIETYPILIKEPVQMPRTEGFSEMFQEMLKHKKKPDKQ